MQVNSKVVSVAAWLLAGLLLIPVEVLAWTLSTPAENTSFAKAASIAGTGMGIGGDAGSFAFGYIPPNTFDYIVENSIAFNVQVMMMGMQNSWTATLAPPVATNVWELSPVGPNPPTREADKMAKVSGAGQNPATVASITVVP